MQRLTTSLIGLAIALVLVVAVNVLSSTLFARARVDLTENSLFSLSDATRKVIAQIDEPIELSLYRSRESASKYLGTYPERVEELLALYAKVSGGKIDFAILNPEPYSETEEDCMRAGVRGLPLPEGETLYFGLAGRNAVGDEQVIPFIDPSKEEFLEYDLTKLVYGLAHPKKQVVGVLSSLPLEGAMNPFQRQAPEPWFVMDQIRQMYETRTILPSATEIPDEVGVLMVVHPKNLSDATLYAIDQFVLRGGKALVFVDPYCENDQPVSDPNNPLSAMMAPRGSQLDKLFDAWGVELVKDKFCGDRKLATPVRWNNRGREESVSYVAWLDLGEGEFDRSEVTTSELGRVRMATAGILRKREGASTEFVPLIQSTAESMEIATSSIQFAPDPPKLLAEFFPGNARLALAARVTGAVKSAFPGGKPAASQPDEAEESAGEEKPHLAESAGPMNAIVVADADLLADPMWVQVMNLGGMRLGSKTADNGDFVINALDFLHGSTDLVSLRARGGSSYPFTVVEELKRDAEQRYRAEEQRLVEAYDSAKRELEQLARDEGAGATLLSAEAEKKQRELREQLIATNKRLREVRHDLNRDVESLGTLLKFVNVWLLPLAIAAAALCVWIYRLTRPRTV